MGSSAYMNPFQSIHSMTVCCLRLLFYRCQPTTPLVSCCSIPRRLSLLRISRTSSPWAWGLLLLALLLLLLLLLHLALCCRCALPPNLQEHTFLSCMPKSLACPAAQGLGKGTSAHTDMFSGNQLCASCTDLFSFVVQGKG